MSDIMYEKNDRPLQKLISFTEQDLDIMKSELDDGWKIVKLFVNGHRYVGVIEQNNDSSEALYIPPNKKIKILSGASL